MFPILVHVIFTCAHSPGISRGSTEGHLTFSFKMLNYTTSDFNWDPLIKESEDSGSKGCDPSVGQQVAVV